MTHIFFAALLTDIGNRLLVLLILTPLSVVCKDLSIKLKANKLVGVYDMDSGGAVFIRRGKGCHFSAFFENGVGDDRWIGEFTLDKSGKEAHGIYNHINRQNDRGKFTLIIEDDKIIASGTPFAAGGEKFCRVWTRIPEADK